MMRNPFEIPDPPLKRHLASRKYSDDSKKPHRGGASW